MTSANKKWDPQLVCVASLTQSSGSDLSLPLGGCFFNRRRVRGAAFWRCRSDRLNHIKSYRASCVTFVSNTITGRKEWSACWFASADGPATSASPDERPRLANLLAGFEPVCFDRSSRLQIMRAAGGSFFGPSSKGSVKTGSFLPRKCSLKKGSKPNDCRSQVKQIRVGFQPLAGCRAADSRRPFGSGKPQISLR